jgi:hypothetical protein
MFKMLRLFIPGESYAGILRLIRRGIIFFSILPAFATPSPVPFLSPADDDTLFQVGEELTYNVSYVGFDIGRVKIKLLSMDGDSAVSAIAYMDSYKGVPLVDLHSVFESNLNMAVYSQNFQARDKDDDHWKLFKYYFDYTKGLVIVEEGIWQSNSIDRRDTIGLDTFYQDGLSLFYFARKHIRNNETVRVPVFVSEKKGIADINFTGQRKKAEIDAVDYPVDVIYISGRAGFIGVFGLTGGFEGWFSNDEAHIPILAKMKVIIGNIRIELMEWKRSGWTPPRYSQDKR